MDKNAVEINDHTSENTTAIIRNDGTIKLKLKRKTEITVDTSAKEIAREAILQKIEALINNEYKKHYNDNPPLKEKIARLQEKDSQQSQKKQYKKEKEQQKPYSS